MEPIQPRGCFQSVDTNDSLVPMCIAVRRPCSEPCDIGLQPPARKDKNTMSCFCFELVMEVGKVRSLATLIQCIKPRKAQMAKRLKPLINASLMFGIHGVMYSSL